MSTTAHHKLPSGSLSTASHRQLVAYFRSGWAFLIPYLAAYLLYAWLKWPVNPVAAGSSPVDGGQLAVSAIGALPSTVPRSTGTPSTAHSLLSTGVPCLLYVYWALHALHLVLGALALRAWWLSTSGEQNYKGKEPGPDHETSASGIRSPVSRAAYAALPWLCLGLLFLIPGSYLEFPSDTWAHYTRLMDFTRHSTLIEIATWTKSSYFLGYSLFGSIDDASSRLSGSNLWYGMCSLLLCWQYCQLARSVNLPTSAAFVFVLLQTILLGNSAFSFYRYYGLSSSLFAQLGAVALIRTAIEIGQRSFNVGTARDALLAGGPLALLVVFNHLQGVAIAGIGLLGVFLRYLIQAKRTWLLVAAALCLMAVNLAAYVWIASSGDPALSRWLTSWRGFDLFSPASPAHTRAMAVLGGLGGLNLITGLILLRHNRIEAWLTVTPVFILMMPSGVLPFALGTSANFENIIVFNRLLLGIPAGLALSSLVWSFVRPAGPTGGPDTDPLRHRRANCTGFALVLVGLVALTVLPAGNDTYNRAWHLLSRPPADLSMAQFSQDDYLIALSRRPVVTSPVFVSLPGMGFVASTLGVKKTVSQTRWMTYPFPQPPSLRIENLSQMFDSTIRSRQSTVLQSPRYQTLTSPYSQAAVLSGHWWPSQVALEFAGGPELDALARAQAGREITMAAARYFEFD